MVLPKQKRPRCRMMQGSRSGPKRQPCPHPVAVGQIYTCALHTEREASFTNPDRCAWCRGVIPPEEGIASAYCSRAHQLLHTRVLADDYPRGPRCARCRRAQTYLYGYELYTCVVCGYDSGMPERTVPGQIAAVGNDLNGLRAMAVQSAWHRER